MDIREIKEHKSAFIEIKKNWKQAEKRRYGMLEYEKKLNLDKLWEKMQSGGILKNKMLLCSIIFYAAFYISLKLIFGFLPDLTLWQSSDILVEFGDVSLRTADAIYCGIGLLVYLYGSIRYLGINKQNHSVRGKSDTPEALLTTGYYAKVRHPMYGVFVICFAAVLLSLQSVIGIVLAFVWAALQYINAFREEKQVLLPLFGDDYRDYARHVQHMLLMPAEAAALIILVVISLAGIFI